MNSIGHGKGTGELSIPPHIGHLDDIDEYEQSEEHNRKASSDHLFEQKAVESEVKRLGHVHGTSEHFRAILHEQINGFKDCPSTHRSGATSLISKLEVIQAKVDSEEKDKNPVNDLQEDTTNGYASIVLTSVDASKLIFYDGD